MNTETNEKLAELEAENRIHRAKETLLAMGANPQKINDLVKLYEAPEMPEEFKDKDGKVLEGDALEKAQKKFIETKQNEFKTSHSYYFGGTQPPPTTDGAQIGTAGLSADEQARQQAASKGDIQGMLKTPKFKQPETTT